MTAIYVVATIFLIMTLPLWAGCGINLLSTRTERELENQVQLHLVYGLFVIALARSSSRIQMRMSILNRITLFRKRLKPSKGRAEKMRGKKKKEKETQSTWQRIEGTNWSELLPALRKLVGEVRNPQIKGRMEIGSRNPMHVGIISGFYSALAGMLPQLRRNFDLTPVFFRDRSLWDLQFSAEIIPVKVAWRGYNIWRVFNRKR